MGERELTNVIKKSVIEEGRTTCYVTLTGKVKGANSAEMLSELRFLEEECSKRKVSIFGHVGVVESHDIDYKKGAKKAFFKIKLKLSN